MAGKQHALRTLALKLNVSGTVEVLDEQRLYKGSYGFIKLQIFVPDTQNTEAPICTVFCTTVNELGTEVISTRNYRLIYVGEKTIDGMLYLLFETYLPKEFTATATQPNGLKITINYCDSKVMTDDEGEILYDDDGVPRRYATALLVSGQYETTVYPGGWNDDSMELDISSAEAAQIAANTQAIEDMQEDMAKVGGYADDAAASADAAAESAESAAERAEAAAQSEANAKASEENAAASAEAAAESAEEAANSASEAENSATAAAGSAIEAAEAADSVTEYLGKTVQFEQELPEVGNEEYIYFLITDESSNLFEIWVYTDEGWEQLGTANLSVGNCKPYTRILLAASWSDNRQTVTISGVTTEDTISAEATVGYAKVYTDFGVRAVDIVEDGIVFECDTVPDDNISVDILVTHNQEITPSNGYYTDDETDALLAAKQDVNDDDLETTAKTVVGAINENKAAIDGLREDVIAQEHFKGFADTSDDVQAITADLNDFAYCMDTGTIWIYGSDGWYDTDEDYPSDATPLATTTPLMDGEAAVGTSSSAAHADHVHPTDTSRASASDLQTETEERTAADAELQTNITAEETARTEADDELQTAINNEAATRNTADQTLEESITTEITRAQTAEEALQESITAEESAREAADTALEESISEEASARSSADETLQTAITAEETARTSADETLQTAITAEETARTSADESLQTAITAEETARTSADETLQTAITAEETARTSADESLQTAITAEETARTSADETLQTAITAEETARTSADESLQSDIDAEASTRAEADETLQTAIDAEESARTAADEALQAAIDAETTARETAEAEFATTAELDVDHETYVITLTLKAKDGTTLAAPTIDLPLESVVVNGSYDDENQSIILTLQNGNTVSVPVGDLVDGLATQTALDEAVAALEAADTALEERIADIKVISEQVTIATSAWSDSNAEVTVDGVTDGSIVEAAAAEGSGQLVAECNIRVTAQGDNLLTFTCDAVPDDTVDINLVIFNI